MSQYRSPWMDDELDLFREAAHRFVANEIVPNDARWREQHHVDRELWTKAGEVGLLCTDIPARLRRRRRRRTPRGCRGRGDWAGTASRASAIPCTASSRTTCSITAPRSRSSAGCRAWRAANWSAAIAMTESGAGSDLQAIRTRAVRDGDDYVLSGSKTFISNGLHAGLVGVVAKTDPARGSKGISIIMVETKDLPGYRVGRVLDKIGQNGWDTAEFFFDDCRVPVDNLLGPRGRAGVRAADARSALRAHAARARRRRRRWNTRCSSPSSTRATARSSARRCSRCRTRASSSRTSRRRCRSRASSSTTASKLNDGRLDTVDGFDGQAVGSPKRRRGDRRVPAALRRLRLHDASTRSRSSTSIRACSGSTAAPTKCMKEIIARSL